MGASEIYISFGEMQAHSTPLRHRRLVEKDTACQDATTMPGIESCASDIMHFWLRCSNRDNWLLSQA